MDETKSTWEYIDEQVVYLTQKLCDLKPGSEEHSRLTEDIERLQKLNLEDSKIGTDGESKDKERELKERELSIRESELESNKKYRILEFIAGTATGVAAIVVPAIIHVKLTEMGFEFETEGSIGAQTTRGILNVASSFVKKGL